jgi:hypothetical protein
VNSLLPNTGGAVKPFIVHACGGATGKSTTSSEWFLYVVEQAGVLNYDYYAGTADSSTIKASHTLPNAVKLLQNDNGGSHLTSVSVDPLQSSVLFVSSSGWASLYALSCPTDSSEPPPIQLIGEASLVDHNQSVVTDGVLVSCSVLPLFLLPVRMRHPKTTHTPSPDELCVLSMAYPNSSKSSQYLAVSSHLVKVVDDELSFELLATSHILAPATTSNQPHTISSGRLRVVTSKSYTSLLMFASVDQLLFVGTLSDEDNAYPEVESDVPGTLPVSWVQIGVGEKVDISISSVVGTEAHGAPNSVAMVVSDYGYCYNSHHHNTRSVPVVCASTPEPSKGVLDYSIGLVQDWLDVASSSVATSQLTPCHSRIFHGSYDQGHNPSVALSTYYQSFSDGKIGFSAVEVHEGLQMDSLFPLANGCGNPIHRDGIVLNSYPFSDWINNILGQVG